MCTQQRVLTRGQSCMRSPCVCWWTIQICKLETGENISTMNTFRLDVLFFSLLLIAHGSLGLLIEDVPSKSVRISCKTCSPRLSSSGFFVRAFRRIAWCDDHAEMTKKVSKRLLWLLGAHLCVERSPYLSSSWLHAALHTFVAQTFSDGSPNHRPMLKRPSLMVIWNAYLQTKWLWRLCGFEYNLD